MWISVVKSGGGGDMAMAGRGPSAGPSKRPPPAGPGVLVLRPHAAVHTCLSAAAALTPAGTTSPAELPSPPYYPTPAPVATTGCPSEGISKEAARTHLPITPPSKLKRLKIFIKSSRRERRKKDEKRRQGEEGGDSSSYQKDFEGNGNARQTRGQRPRVTHTEKTLGRPFSPWDNQHGQAIPPRRSFRLTGVQSQKSGQNMLPLWLEEKPGAPPHPALNTNTTKQVPVSDNSSFETRWDSIRGKNKLHASHQRGQKPHGWEDIDNSNMVNNTRNSKSTHYSSFCISNSVNSTDNQQLASGGTFNINNSRQWSEIFHTPHHFRDGSWGNVHFSKNTNEEFSDFLHKARRHSISTSNMASESALCFSAKTGGDNVSTNITDPHLWASSDSFFCEDFTFFCRKGKYEYGKDILDQPRSYSQVMICENPSENFDDHSQANDSEPSQDFPPDDMQMNYHSHVAFKQISGKHVPDTPPLDRLSLNESFVDSSEITHVTYCASEATLPQNNTDRTSDATLRLADTTCREHWVQFDDGSLDQLNLDTLAAQGTSVPQTLSLNINLQNNQVSEESVVTPSSNDGHCKSILSLRESGMMHSSGSYKGRLLRTYSQRGRRASKRVISSVSRRMAAPEYEKVPQPKPPMYSKVLMTMQGGPGLFESPTITYDSHKEDAEPVRADKSSQEKEESAKKNSVEPISLSTAVASKSFLETAKAEQVGSRRVPRLSAALVQRSVSLNTPRVERSEVSFQRLSDHRPGSFRKAISGLGALARSFRRKSNTGQKGGAGAGETSKNTTVAASTQSIHCTGSFNVGARRQTPCAPRLPRRTISHRSVISEEPHRPTPQV